VRVWQPPCLSKGHRCPTLPSRCFLYGMMLTGTEIPIYLLQISGI